MHRSAFCALLFILFYASSLSAQQGSIEINWHYQEGQSQLLETWIHPVDRSESCYILRSAIIEEVRLSEGRLKDFLPYQYEGDRLCFKLPAEADTKARVYIRYRIDWSTMESSAFIALLEPGFVLNALNVEAPSGNGDAGQLFPAPADGDKQMMRLNLSLPEKLSLESPLKTEFEVTKDKALSLFLKSEQALCMSDFYLAIGDFRHFDLDDVQESIADQNMILEDQKIEDFQGRHQDLINYIAREKDWMFTREGLLGLSGIKASTTVPGFPKKEDLKGSANHLAIQIAILEEFFSEDWQQHWAQYWKEKMSDTDWQEMLRKYKAEGNENPLFWEYYMAYYLESKGLSWADTNQSLRPQDSLEIVKARFFQKSRKALVVDINYRLMARENRLYLYTKFADSIVLPTEITGQLSFQADSQRFDIKANLKQQDTLFIEIAEAPRSLYLDPDPWGLISWRENRPLTYLLNDLSQGPSPKIRRQALLKLLESAQPKLLTTVVGVALDSEDPELRKLGLEKFSSLRPDGKNKLRSSLEAMAQDEADVKLKQKAQELLLEMEP